VKASEVPETGWLIHPVEDDVCCTCPLCSPRPVALFPLTDDAAVEVYILNGRPTVWFVAGNTGQRLGDMCDHDWNVEHLSLGGVPEIVEALGLADRLGEFVGDRGE
jgi:hypothetical protein